MNYTENVLLGVLSGVLTSGLLFGLGTFFVKVLSPWLRSIRYQGVDVSGTYTAELVNDPGEPNSHITLTLIQSAYELSGTFHMLHKKPANAFELTFEVRGRLWDNYLSLSMVPVDRKVTSIANGLFRFIGGGVGLQGVMVIRDTFAEQVVSNQLVLRRQKT